jgi:hypothetical protein
VKRDALQGEWSTILHNFFPRLSFIVSELWCDLLRAKQRNARRIVESLSLHLPGKSENETKYSLSVAGKTVDNRVDTCPDTSLTCILSLCILISGFLAGSGT